MANETLGATYSLLIERFGALGIKEIDFEFGSIGRSEVAAHLEQHLSTMGPLDSARIEIRRTDRGRAG